MTTYILLPGFKNYRASSDGFIETLKKSGWRKLNGSFDKDGYKTITISSNNIPQTLKVHKIICTLFHGEKPDGLEVRHLDGNQHNNSADNLEWGTHVSNMRDKVNHGRSFNVPRGIQCHKARLNEQDVRDIKNMYLDGLSMKRISVIYSVGSTTIRDIINGKTWTHI